MCNQYIKKGADSKKRTIGQFPFFPCVQTFISTLAKNRITVLHHWSQIEEAVRYLDSLPIDQKKAVLKQHMEVMAPQIVGKKFTSPKYKLELLIILSDQGRYTTECLTTTNYQVFQP